MANSLQSWLLAAALAFTSTGTSAAATKFWKNGLAAGPWSGSNSWSATSAAGGDNAGMPAAHEPVRIVHNDGFARIVTLDVSTPTLGLVVVDLTGSSLQSTLSIPNNVNLTAGAMFVGGHNGVSPTNGRGAVVQSAGSVAMASGLDLALGHGVGSTGTYTLSGGSLTASQSEFIGYAGSGTLTQSGGTNTINLNSIGSLSMGTLPTGVGTYNLSGTGELIADRDTYIGVQGVGIFNQSGGSLKIGHSALLYLGYNTSGTGTFTLSGGALTARYEYIGWDGAGTFNQSGGTNTISGDLVIADRPGSTGAYNQTGGTTTCEELFFGNLQSTASYKLSGTAVLAPRSAYVRGKLEIDGGGTMRSTFAAIDRSTGIASVRGKGSSWTNDGRIIVSGSGGSLSIANGGRVTSDGTEVGFGAGTFGSITVGGADATLNSRYLEIGAFNATGTVTLQDRGVVNLTQLLIRANSTLNMQGGLLRFASYDRHPTATLNFQAGTIQLSGDRTIGADAAVADFFGSSPTIPLSKGLVIEGGAAISTGVAIAGGTLHAGLVLVNAGGNINGFGTVSTASFASIINNGQILGTSATQRILLPGQVTGVGMFNNVRFAGTLSPGVSAASLSVGAVDFAPTSALFMEIGGTSPGSQHDRIVASGQLGFDGTLQVSLINGFTPSLGQSFNLFDWATLSGTFDRLNLPTIGGSLTWDTSQLYATGVISVAAISSDFDGNGAVDGSDLARWRAGFGNGTTHLQGDANYDGIVDGRDFLIWQRQFGSSGVSATSSAVPEPATMILLVLAISCVSLKPRKTMA